MYKQYDVDSIIGGIMTIAKSTHQFYSGMQNIEQAIIEKLRESDIHITADNFLWQGGHEFVPTPESITLEIKVQNRSANAVFGRKHLEDSWARIYRQDVAATVREIVADLI
jgi:hypothetical protein